MTTLTPQQVLQLPLEQPNDANAETIRDYLIKLLQTLWTELEDFNSKRPFGNSGWDWDLATPLIKANVISGTLDSEGYLLDCDSQALQDTISAAIAALAP